LLARAQIVALPDDRTPGPTERCRPQSAQQIGVGVGLDLPGEHQLTLVNSPSHTGEFR